MAKVKTKADLEQRIAELEEYLNTSNNAYNELMKRYNELNAKKGDIVGYEQMKQELERKELMYDILRENYTHERTKRENLHKEFRQMKLEYNDLQEEHEQLQADYNELSNKYNNIIGTKRSKGRPKKEVCASVGEIKARMKQGETAEQIAEDLGISRMTLFRRLKNNKNK